MDDSEVEERKDVSDFYHGGGGETDASEVEAEAGYDNYPDLDLSLGFAAAKPDSRSNEESQKKKDKLFSAAAKPDSRSNEESQTRREESQNKRDWDSFTQYLKDKRPPPRPPSEWDSKDVIAYLKVLGNSKVHVAGCLYFGEPDSSAPCSCPLRDRCRHLNGIIHRLGKIYEENFGSSLPNPFTHPRVSNYLDQLRQKRKKRKNTFRATVKPKKNKPSLSVLTEVTNAGSSTALSGRNLSLSSTALGGRVGHTMLQSSFHEWSCSAGDSEVKPLLSKVQGGQCMVDVENLTLVVAMFQHLGLDLAFRKQRPDNLQTANLRKYLALPFFPKRRDKALLCQDPFRNNIGRGECHNDTTPNEEPTSTTDVMSETVSTSSSDRLPSHLRRCLLYASLFPRNYEFDKANLIHLWIAAGFIQEKEHEVIEDTGNYYFEELLSMNLFQESSPANLDQPRFYKLEDEAHYLVQNYSVGEYARLEHGRVNDISGQVRHLSLLSDKIDQVHFESPKTLGGLHSILLFHDQKKHITYIPYDLLLNLRCLRVLDLSRTRLTELPSSVGSLEDLRYLDLSETCIKWLPLSLTSLSKLQVLRLRDCYEFSELPKDTTDMISLRHLDLDIIRQLTFMPPGMGKLTNLQTLSAFIVGTDCGYQIAELKNMSNLRGSLSIIKLEHVHTSEDAKEAMLSNKKYLRRLVMQWSSSFGAEEVLEALEPHKHLEELEIISYGGLIFSTWLGDPSFSKLSNIYFYNCKNSVLLPPLGQLPCLKVLRIGELHAIKEIDHLFCGGGGKGFPRLETLHFDGMPCLEMWTGTGEDEMPCLQELKIVDCPELVQLPNLSQFKSLQHLELSYCFKLMFFTEGGFSNSLQSLVINDCPILEERCCKGGADWEKIASIASIRVNYQQVSKN